VVADISAKLVRRHPHVFGNVQVNGTDEIVANWEKIKQSENRDKQKKPSLPRGLPALTRAQKVAQRAQVASSIPEIQTSIAKLPRARNREKLLGEILFALAAYASTKQIDAESALRVVANSKVE
jgi:uncharacterized protein YabN with tetrapyrrole methylase and pyrophosphatase domain